jgi:hypothetical protein
MPDRWGRSMDQPFLLLMTAADMRRPTAAELARMNMTQKDLDPSRIEALRLKRTQFFASIQGGSYSVVMNVPGISHMSFSDLPYPAADEPDAKKNAQRSLDITRAYALAFFDKYLKHLPDSLLDMRSRLIQRSRANTSRPHVPEAPSASDRL